MFWSNSKNHNSIEILKKVDSEKVTWNSDSILLWVNSDVGGLRFSKGRSSKGLIKGLLLLNDIPLIKWHDNEYSCPTCEKLISAGLGIERVDTKILKRIRTITLERNNLEASIDRISPILNLLEQGFYLISFIKLHPTDGVGNFFWTINNSPKYLPSTCDTYYMCNVAAAFPAFIMPTQSPAKFNSECVESYRERIRAGEEFCGIAYYLDGYLCGLLDGHHRATACLLEEEDFYCLTIIPLSGWCNYVNEKRESLLFSDYQIDKNDLPANYVEVACKKWARSCGLNISSNKVDEYINMVSESWNNMIWSKEFSEKAKSYITVEGLAAIQLAGDLTDERINRLQDFETRYQQEEMELVLKALIAKKDRRVLGLALKIGKSESCRPIWRSAFEYLATNKSQEAEDFFINFLINDDHTRPELTKIAEDYFR